MERLLYVATLLATGVLNMLIAIFLLKDSKHYREQTDYYRARILTVVWLFAFGIGYLVHAVFQWRFTWPTAASALTASYFHIGAVCFSWGYTPLLDPTYFTKKIVVRDSVLLAVGLIVYWTAALLRVYAPFYSLFSFLFFFIYAFIVAYTFYTTFNRVSYRRIRMGAGSISGFIQWMQICCDLIVLFGIGSVAITAAFHTEVIPFCLLLIAGFGMFAYIAYSIDKYGPVITKSASHPISHSTSHLRV